MVTRGVVVLVGLLAVCGSHACASSFAGDRDDEPIDERARMGRCDPHEGPPEVTPDFLAETFAQLTPAAREACLLERVNRGPDGVAFPPLAEWTAEEITGACAAAPTECAAVCEAALGAEVALRLYRRVQRGTWRIHRATSIDPDCGGLIATAPDTLDAERARALWSCLDDEPLPERVELTLTLENDASGTRRVADLAVRADFVPPGAESPGQVHELHMVEVDSGCGHVSARLTIVGPVPLHAGSPTEVCREHDRNQCQARCDETGAQCDFVLTPVH